MLFEEVYSFSIVILYKFESGVLSSGHLLEDFLFEAFLFRQVFTEKFYYIMCAVS